MKLKQVLFTIKESQNKNNIKKKQEKLINKKRKTPTATKLLIDFQKVFSTNEITTAVGINATEIDATV